MVNAVRIGQRLVGEGQPCFILAEAGVNHNGDPKLAEDLVRIAADCKADAVKFQKRTLHELLTRAAIEKPYVNSNSLGATYGEHRLKLELSDEVWRRLRDLALSLDLEFLGSAWDRSSADLLEALDTPAFKTASAVLTDLDLLEYIARKNRPMIVSTGMSTIEEVDQAVERIVRFNDQLILLQCTSSYPSEFADVNLRVMDTYRQRYGVLVGYSGHERGISVTEAAATLGACLVERHFTRDRTLPWARPRRVARTDRAGQAGARYSPDRSGHGLGEKRLAPAEVPVRMGLEILATSRSAVVLPAPLRPISAIDSPRFTPSVTSRNAQWSWSRVPWP